MPKARSIAGDCSPDASPRRPLPVITLTLASGACLAHLVSGAAEWLCYDRERLWEVWRVLTCHLVHWNPEHLLWSGGAFVLLGGACEARGRGRFLVCAALSAVAIPLALRFAAPAMGSYGGLSGIDSALFTMLAAATVLDNHRARRKALAWGACIALILFLCKLAYEIETGSAVFLSDSPHQRPIPMAHIVGGAAGVVVPLNDLVRRLLAAYAWKNKGPERTGCQPENREAFELQRN